MIPVTTALDLVAADGTALAGDVVEPPGEAGGTVVLNPATAVRRGFYLPFARFLAGQGFRVVLYDYRGVGGSRPPRLRGFRATMRDWAEQDTEAALRHALASWPDDPLLVVGHSFGGQGLAMVASAPRVAGAVLVASQNGWWRYWDGLPRLGMAALWYVGIPVLTRLFGYFPGRLGIGEDLPAGVARTWARWGRRRDYLFSELTDAERRRLDGELSFPIRAYSLADDLYAPRRSVEALLARYRAAAVEHHHLSPADFGQRRVAHFGFFKERVGGSRWPEVSSWLRERI